MLTRPVLNVVRREYNSCPCNGRFVPYLSISSSMTQPFAQMGAPMSDWFRSVPIGLHAIAYAAKAGVYDYADFLFIEQVSSFNKKHSQPRSVITCLNTSSNVLLLSDSNMRYQNSTSTTPCFNVSLVPPCDQTYFFFFDF